MWDGPDVLARFVGAGCTCQQASWTGQILVHRLHLHLSFNEKGLKEVCKAQAHQRAQQTPTYA